MSRFRPQIKPDSRTPDNPIPTAGPTEPELAGPPDRPQSGLDELRLLSGIHEVAEHAAPVKQGINWLLIANLVATLACLILVAITIARLNTVEESLRAYRSSHEAAMKAAQEAEAAAKATESAMKRWESRLAQQASAPEPNRTKKSPVPRRK